MIYADNAATTKMSDGAAKVFVSLLDEAWGNPSSLYAHGQKAKEVLEQARQDVAACFGAQPREIYFTSCGSESDNQAIISAATAGKKLDKTHIISTAVEHHAVLHTLEKLKAQGFDVQLLEPDTNGAVTAQQVADAVRSDTCLVTVMYANNEIGTINPIAAIGAACREKGVPFHTDAVQAAGHIPIDVRADNIDMLSLSAHKFYGPKGAGVLFARKGTALESLIIGGAQESGKRAGTQNVPAIVGAAQAFKESCEQMQTAAQHDTALRDKLIEGLSKIPHSALNGDRLDRLPGNVSFCFEDVDGESLLLLLDEKGICASSGSACSSGSMEPSHVLLAVGRSRETAQGALRLSLGRYNTPQETDIIIQTVTQTVDYLRSFSQSWNDKLRGKKPFLL